MEEIYVTPVELAAECQVNRNAIYKAMNAGRLAFVEMYGKRLIPQAAASHYKAEQGVRNGARKKKGEAVNGTL